MRRRRTYLPQRQRRKEIFVKKRGILFFLAAALSIQLTAGCAAADAGGVETLSAGTVQAKSGNNAADAQNGKSVVKDPDAYENMEILALTESGEPEVYRCSSGEMLEETIAALQKRDDISIVQPNYVYESQGLNVNDELAGEQWALYNDGSFYIEEEKNIYPVYDDPFGAPAAPGEWKNDESGGPGWQDPQLIGFMVEVERQKADAGIDINISDAWARYGTGSRDVVVAMLDTGIDYSHPDLRDAIWSNSGEIPGNGADDDGNGYVDDVNGWNFYDNNNQVFTGSDDSHGTHGAGTIVASGNNGTGIAGIVPQGRVKIMPVKILGGDQGGGSTASLIRAIRYAETNGAVICNLSLTTTVEDHALYQAMASSKMLFVVAAGNGDETSGMGVNTDETPFYPAAFDLDNIISVANLNFSGYLNSSSNFGSTTVDIAAPGTYILSTTPGSSYGYMTGTSMAAPMVTGTAALIYSCFDGISVSDVKEILLSSARPLDSLQGLVSTGGMLDAGAALAFDLSGLSGQSFSNAGYAPENGSAPYIETKFTTKMDSGYLIVRVVDVDGDLETLVYQEGNLSSEEFQSGAVGKAFTVNTSDLATFRVDHAGTYTFYARDRKGNETVRTVRITEESEGPGA